MLEGLSDVLQQKEETFEVSTLSAVLEQLGATKAAIRGVKASLLEAYGFTWFNELGLLPRPVRSARVFKYDLLDGFEGKSSYPVTTAFEAALKDAGEPVDLVFKCFQHGRLIATPDHMSSTPGLVIPTGVSVPYKIVRFAGYYRNRFGTPIQDNPRILDV